MPAYDEVLSRNCRAARSRLGLGQERLAARMRALGYTAWLRQTVSKTEKGERRLSAAEIVGLALALETSMRELMAPTAADKTVDLQGGAIDFRIVVELIKGDNVGAVQWEGDVPKFLPKSWWVDERPDVPLPGHRTTPTGAWQDEDN